MVSRQREGHDLGFGGSYEPVAARIEPEQVAVSRSVGSLGSKRLLILGGVLMLGALAFGFMKFLSSSGKEIGADNQQIIGQVDTGKDRDAQMGARNALIASKVIFVDDGSYSGVDPGSLAQVEPALHYTTGPSAGATSVSVSAMANQIGIAVSSGKTCWYLSDSPTKGTKYGSGTGPCTGAVAIRVATSPSW
jgi:hypothetical protein